MAVSAAMPDEKPTAASAASSLASAFSKRATVGLYRRAYTGLSALAAPATSVSRLPVPSSRLLSGYVVRSEEHTSELQSRGHLVCRLLLENKQTSHDSQH